MPQHGILEIKGGYNGFHWTNAPQDVMLGTPEYRVPGLTFGAPYNYPQTLNQNNWTGRADFSLHKAHRKPVCLGFLDKYPIQRNREF